MLVVKKMMSDQAKVRREGEEIWVPAEVRRGGGEDTTGPVLSCAVVDRGVIP